MPKPNNPDIITGNEALIMMNGKTVGFGKNLRYSGNNNMRQIQVLGSRKPKGLKSLNWDGSVDMEFHILSVPQEGVVEINTVSDETADDLYSILVIHKKTKQRIGKFIGGVNTEGFSLQNNDFSGRTIQFALVDWQPMEAFN